MSKVRNISPQALQIQRRGVWSLVEPDAVTDVPDEDLASYVERLALDGESVEPSDLWVEVADFVSPVPAPEEVAP